MFTTKCHTIILQKISILDFWINSCDFELYFICKKKFSAFENWDPQLNCQCELLRYTKNNIFSILSNIFFVMTIMVSACLKYEANYHVSQLEKNNLKFNVWRKEKTFFHWLLPKRYRQHVAAYEPELKMTLVPKTSSWLQEGNTCSWRSDLCHRSDLIAQLM